MRSHVNCVGVPTAWPVRMQNTMDRSILIVDDEPRWRSCYENNLRLAGYERVDVAAGRDEALQKAKNWRYDVAVVDMRLERPSDPSDTSGYSLASELKKLDEFIAIVMKSCFQIEKRRWRS